MLTFVPTPIGNLEDITYRSIRKIQEAEIFICEDTRLSKKLLNLLNTHFNLAIDAGSKTFLTLNSHTRGAEIDAMAKILQEKSCVFLSDAGMPCISDPGQSLVAYCQEKGIKYEFLPGASAAALAYAMSGFEDKEFVFFGFLHNTNPKRGEDLSAVLNMPYPVVIYESPKRILSLATDLAAKDPARTVFAAKELTKMHEFFIKKPAGDLPQILGGVDLRGEWCLVISGQKKGLDLDLLEAKILGLDLRPKEKARLLAHLSCKPAAYWYERIVSQS